MFRQHQQKFDALCREIAARHLNRDANRETPAHSIICSVTPGGGKSLLPVIAAGHLLGSVDQRAFADRLCWVVPRRALQLQAESEFLKPLARELLGEGFLIRRSANEADPCRGLNGFATTYQAVGFGNHHLIEEFSSHRYVLFLDEPHHVEEGGAWHQALEPLVRRAALTIYMSGTLERGNRRRIAFLPYQTSGQEDVIGLHAPGVASVSYSRRDALHDRAITPIHFELMDGTAQWIGRDGETYSTQLSTANKDTAEALYTALKTQFAVQLLDECANHWSEYRREHPRAKLLVVTANIEDAKKYVLHLKQANIRAAIATSDDSTQASKNIERFKSHAARSLDALVTVAMAYEGLDVPAVTHIACLTHIRSKPWIEQMIARATRFDPQAGEWESQTAFVYVPDDKGMCAIIQAMQDEQVLAVKQIKDAEEYEELLERYEEQEDRERRTITPVGSSGSGRRWNRVGHFAPRESAGESSVMLIAPSVREAQLREELQTFCKRVDAVYFDSRWGETNRRVVVNFGRARTAMNLTELEQVMAWLEQNYPLRATKKYA